MKIVLPSDNMPIKLMPKTSQSTHMDSETELVTSLSAAMTNAGFSASPNHFINFYVALKSKPLAILAGPAKSGKTALVHNLALSLCECESLRVQMILGHPWWAEKCENVATYTQIHARFSTEKILAMIEEANQPGNRA